MDRDLLIRANHLAQRIDHLKLYKTYLTQMTKGSKFEIKITTNILNCEGHNQLMYLPEFNQMNPDDESVLLKAIDNQIKELETELTEL